MLENNNDVGVNLRGVGRNRYLQRVENNARAKLKKQRQSSMCIEFFWLFFVLTLYVFVFVDKDEELKWYYQFFFIE